MHVSRTPVILYECVWNLPPNVPGLLVFVNLG